jgi:hypothetical protein
VAPVIPGFDEPTPAELVQHGYVYPGDWVSPVMRGRPEAWEFCGTAALLGNNLFLTARHVIEDSLAARGLDEDETFWLHWTDAPGGNAFAASVSDWEFHPDSAVDLAVGRFEGRSSGAPFVGGITLPQLGKNLQMVGFPSDRVLGLKEAEPRFHWRFLMGHVTGAVDPAAPTALELSFPVVAGMSGSPIYYHEPPSAPLLVGIAVGNRESYIAQRESIFQGEEDAPDRIFRVVEYGVAVRLSLCVRWEIVLANGELGTLVPGVVGNPHVENP